MHDSQYELSAADTLRSVLNRFKHIVQFVVNTLYSLLVFVKQPNCTFYLMTVVPVHVCVLFCLPFRLCAI